MATRTARCRPARWALALAAGLLAAPVAPANAQPDEEAAPVFIADAPLAEEALGTLDALLARGGADEAVRLIQRVLEEQGDRLVDADEPGLFVSVRRRVHERVLADPALLEAYRVRQTPRARVLLEEGRWAEVARRAWLTAPGFEASLRSAQTLIESGSFAAGVRVLSELLAHPDARAGAPDAADLAALGAAYDGTDRAWSVADAWAERAGRTAPERRRIGPPESDAERAARSLEWSTPSRGAFAPEGIVSRALHRGELTELDPSDESEPAGRPGSMQRIEMGWALPTLAGPDLLTNDGLTLTRFDRFTLRPHWRLREATPGEDGSTRQARSRLGRIVEDSASVTVDGDRVYAAMGVARSVTDESTGRLVCVDRATGRVIWSALLGSLDESLRGAEPRGPIVVDGDTVVVGARKNLRSRRLVSLTLIGLDKHTGRLRWSRALGSAGSLPFQQLTQLSEGGVLGDGVVYWTDKIGLVGAVETATGSVRWVRATRAPGLYTRGMRTPYATSLPVLNDHGLFVLTPDQSAVLRIDPGTGELLGSRTAEPANDASYLIALDQDRFAAVGSRGVAFYNAARFDRGDVRVTPDLDERAVRGRAVAVAGRLAVPVEAGVALVDPDGAMETRVIELDATGNVVVDAGQIIVADETHARSFLSWETASTMLERRVREGDIGSALALAELAQRSGHEDRVLDAIDEAVRLARRADDDGVWRERVFESVRRLADPDAGAGAAGGAIRGALLERMGAVARTDEQRVAHAMATGAWRAATGDAPGAAAAYQEILLDRAWSRTVWSGGGLTVRAELEATRRLHELADRYGSRATATAESLAQAEAASLADAGTPDQWETIARRYPATTAAPNAWARAAAEWALAESPDAAERAARTGLRAAQRAARRGQTIPDGAVGELLGALLASLDEQQRADEAAEIIAQAEETFGPTPPTLAGRPVALSPATPAREGPALGPRLARADTPALLPGVPVAESVPGAPGIVLMYEIQHGALAAYSAEDLADARGPGAALALWRDDTVGLMPPVLARADSGSIVLVWPDELEGARPARVEARDTRSGQPLWSTNLRMPIDRVDPGPDPAARLNGQIVTPLEGPVSNSHLLVVSDGRTVIVSDRLARAVGVDASDGRLLWSRRLGMTRLYSMDVGGGILGAAGVVSRAPGGRDADMDNPALRAVAEALDARSGETIQLAEDLGQETRWVRVAPDGQVIVGASARLLAMDTVAGRVDWANADDELAGSTDAWVLGETLLVLGADRALWPVSRREGLLARTPFDTGARHADRDALAIDRRGQRLIVRGTLGLTVHAPEGDLLGADATDAGPGYGATALGRRRAVLVGRAETDETGRTRVGVALVDAETGRLEDRVTIALPEGVRRAPSRVALGDGVVVIGFGEVSVVLAAPGAEG